LKVTIYSQEQQTNEVDLGSSVELCDSYAQVYDDIDRFVMKLTRPYSFMLMFWIFKNLDKDNRIRLSSIDKKRFIKSIEDNGGKICCLRNVNYAIKELVSVGFMSMIHRGIYEASIISLSKSGSNARIARIKERLYRLPRNADFINGLPIKKVTKSG
jgi:hypothetical protein